jgi:hypothetical protein
VQEKLLVLGLLKELVQPSLASLELLEAGKFQLLEHQRLRSELQT